MRTLPFLLVLALAVAGCSGGGGAKAKEGEGAAFDDLGVEATDTTGVLIGVVVDEAIRPLPGAAIDVVGPDAATHDAVTDDEGRFAFGGLAPGNYIVSAELLNFQPAQTTANVVAGIDEPPVLRIQLTPLFDQTAFIEQIQFDGFLSCSISFPVGTTCVNDYTRLVGERCTPSPAPEVCTSQCKGGCFREQNLARAAGNIREYVSTVGPGWQAIVFETTWDRTSDYSSEELTLSVSFFTRPDAGHFYGNKESPNPLRLQLDVGVEGPGQQQEPTMIPPEGTNELFSFFNAGGVPPGGGVAVNQAFRHFQHTFYYGLPPPDWSFVKGDPMPF